jgi:hypothetical protein
MITLFFAYASSYRHQNNIVDSSLLDTKSENENIPIAGIWVSENYINSLKEKKSPRIAQQGNSFLIVIPERTNEKTSIMDGFHDDFDNYFILKNQNRFEIWETHDNRLTKLEYIIEVISSSKIKIGETILIKIDASTVKDFLHYGLKEEILIQEELLFKGIYLTSDGKKVELKKNGQINGLDSFYYYKPINDYYDEGMQVDQLILVKLEKNIDWKDLEYYGFKFNCDTLELYKLNCLEFDSTSRNCGVVELGKLEYKLWKINNNH